LEEEEKARRYLLRLQNLAGSQPLVISEFGMDVHHSSVGQQAEVRQWFHRVTQGLGVAGRVWFSYTDEWWRSGGQVTPWKFGLVDVQRSMRPAAALPLQPAAAPASPMISVVVCTRNGAATLEGCLLSLQHQSYPHYEVLVVDDGSTDQVPSIAQSFPTVRYIHQEHAGLSVARNRGMAEARGEIIAYTDDDCRADADWLLYLSQGFAEEQWSAAGGPNLPPPPRNRTEAVVAAAPGGPAHVLLTDEEAEHLPGCNLAIRKSALQSIGGFQPQYRAAGDDVDVCWRLREAGGKLRFIPAAMVWHHRRFTVQAYFRQQRGYGRAEALLMQGHPQRFGPLGGAHWRGLIYGDNATALPPREGSIFHGPLGNGLFQVIYNSSAGYSWWTWLEGVLWPCITLALALLGLPYGAGAVLLCAGYQAWKKSHAQLHPAALSLRERSLLWWLCLVQPMVREWARLHGMWQLRAWPGALTHLPDILPPLRPRKWTLRMGQLSYWSEKGVGRDALLTELAKLTEADTSRWDDGWRWLDVEFHPQRPLCAALITVTEFHGAGRCLTRVALLLRIRRWFALTVVLALAACCYFSFIAAATGAVSLLLLPLMMRAKTKRRVQEAAKAVADCSKQAGPLLIVQTAVPAFSASGWG
jgi:O-antigen biosynthesis protein